MSVSDEYFCGLMVESKPDSLSRQLPTTADMVLAIYTTVALILA